MDDLKNIGILASGSGSNAENIIQHFQNSDVARVAVVVTNNPNAGVIDRAKKYGVEVKVVGNADLDSDLLKVLKLHNVDVVALAGFLRMIPMNVIQAYPGHILNIHPALLPKFGGKGMYGMNVHKAVKEAGETHSGMTIHLVTENYDEGTRLFQARTPIDSHDTAEDIASKVLQLEHKYYPRIIEAICQQQLV